MVIAITNHKGGVGKTTSAINVGAGLARLGKRVLLIDLDPQANLTQSLGIREPKETVYGSIRGDYPLKPLHIVENLDAVPSTLDLSGAEVELNSETGREYILRELLEGVKSRYDYVLIDSPPSLGLLTVNALTSADEILIPLQAQYLALQGLTKLLEIVEKVKKRLNKGLRIGGVFITQYDNRKTLNRDVVEVIQGHFQDKVLNAKIRDNVALAEAPARGQDIYRYSPNSYGATDYLELCAEILQRHS